jgi:hypothetical protein
LIANTSGDGSWSISWGSRKSSERSAPKALYWSAALAIIGGFVRTEVKIGLLLQDWAQTALIYAFVFVEIVIVFL